MSIDRLLMRLFSAFCGGKALNWNVQHFVWPDLWRHRWPRVKFFSCIWMISSRALHSQLNFSATSIGYRDRWGSATAPQQRAGVGLGPAGRRWSRMIRPGDLTWLPTIFHVTCKIAQWKSMPSLVTLLLSVSEVLAKNHGGGGGKTIPTPG